MPSLWVPNAAADAILADQGHAEARRFVGFRNRLKAMDSRMDAFLCDTFDPENPELRVGFYYLTRRNDNGTTAFFEISHPDGSFREPDDVLIDNLQKIDRDTLTDLRSRREEKRRKAAREAQRKKEEAAGRLKEEIDFAFRVQMPITRTWKDAVDGAG